MSQFRRTRGPAWLAGLTILFLAHGCSDPSAPGGSGSVSVTAVVVTASAGTVPLPGTVRVTARVQPTGASQSVTWASSDPTIATVSSSGVVTTLLTGTVTITATSTANPAISGSIQLSITCPTPRPVTSNISANTTWDDWVPDPACFDYVVQTDLVFNAAILTIQPGAVIGFEQGLGMRVRGDAGLVAEGTAAKPIRLTGTTMQRGFWKGVSIEFSTYADNVIAYATIEYTGGADISNAQNASLMVLGSGTIVRLDDSTLQESSGYGLFLDRDVVLYGPDGHNVMTRNALGPAWAYASEVNDFVGGSAVVTGNDVDEIAVFPTSVVGGPVWTKAVYRILQDPARQAFNVLESLVLDPGVTLRFEGDMAMLVSDGGVLTAVGTAADPIVLTGTQHTPGHWRGLGFLNTTDANNRLDHVVIEYGGSDRVGAALPANLALCCGVGGESRVKITNSVIRFGGAYGLYVSDPSRPDGFMNNTITANALGAAYVDAPVVDDFLAGNVMSGNQVDEIVVEIQAGGIPDADTWRDLGAAYRLHFGGAPNLRVTGSLTIEPGVDVLFDDDTGIEVWSGAFLRAEGTQLNPITMSAKNSKWWGISFLDGGGSFDYLTVSDAGSRAWGGTLEKGAFAIRTNDAANPPSATVKLTGMVSFSGGGYAVVFGWGDTYVQGCPGNVFIPPPDAVSDHCRPG